MTEKLIYLADDEKSIRDVIEAFLQSEGYRINAFENGGELFHRFTEKPCDLAILDVMMPVMDGYETCKKIREISTIPIIMLSARDTEMDYATGINIGCDDYFTKPFSAISLMMRVKAIFRRIEMDKNTIPNEEQSSLFFGDITIKENKKVVLVKAVQLELTPNEYSLIVYLLKNKDRAVSREELLNNIWGYSFDIETRVTDDTVRRLRKKISLSNIAIETVWGFGFCLKKKKVSE